MVASARRPAEGRDPPHTMALACHLRPAAPHAEFVCRDARPPVTSTDVWEAIVVTGDHFHHPHISGQELRGVKDVTRHHFRPPHATPHELRVAKDATRDHFRTPQPWGWAKALRSVMGTQLSPVVARDSRSDSSLPASDGSGSIRRLRLQPARAAPEPT